MAKKAKSPVAKVDFRKLYPELYQASRDIGEVRARRGVFLAVDGAGEPGDKGYQAAVGALYALAYAVKSSLKKAGVADFAVPALECLYFDEAVTEQKREWHWRLQLRLPDDVPRSALAEVRKAVAGKNGPDTRAVRRIAWAEGRALQACHFGPYGELGEAYRRLMAEAAARGLVCGAPAHEIYLNDPRRVPPDRLKTIVRMPVRAGKA